MTAPRKKGTPDPHSCQKCGAADPGLVCQYCGTMSVALGDAGSEMAGLEEFSRLLQSKDAEGQAKLLETGFIPSTPAALIEAGARCITLVRLGHAEHLGNLALFRLEAIVLKLKLLEPTPDVQRALAQFEPVIKDFKAKESSDTFWGLTVFGILSLAIILVCAYLLMKTCG